MGTIPVGTLQSVECGAATATELQNLGDANAATDAAQCATALRNCKANIPDIFDGAAVRVIKVADGVWSLNGSECTRGAQPQVTAALVRAQVVRLIPPAAVGVAPHGATLVNIETVLWVHAPRHDTLRTVQILGRTVRITLTLDHVSWDFGDGDTDTTTGPEPAYSQNNPCTTKQCPDYYGHTYLRPGHPTLTATASWTARFTVDANQPVTIPGTVEGPTARLRLDVKQARAVLVPNPGH